MYNSERFLRFANAYLQEAIKEDVIAEVSERVAANTETQLASALKPQGSPSYSETYSMKPSNITEADKPLTKPQDLKASTAKPAKNNDKPEG